MSAVARRRFGHAAVALTYLGLAVGLWWRLWSAHPTSTATCGCGDTSLLTWFMAWPAWVTSHGGSLLFSTRAAHPAGINLAANTSFLALSLPLTPITRLFGPVASLAVAATAAPVAGALSARAVVLRWTSWRPAAFVAGLLYGFSPFVLENLSMEHVDFATLAIPPLLLIGLDELLLAQRGRWWTWGAAVGGLAAVQFFISPEVLAACALSAVVGLGLLGSGLALGHRTISPPRIRHAVSGGLLAGLIAAVLLAWPAWFALAGPRHLPAKVFPGVEYFGATWSSILFSAGAAQRGPNAVTEVYGSFGPHPLPLGFLGWILATVLATGLVAFRRDLRLVWCTAMVVIMEWCSLGARAWPWRLLHHLPLLSNMVPNRLAALADLFAAGALGLVVGHVHEVLTERSGALPPRWVGTVAAVGAGAVAALALLPIALPEAQPLTVRPIDVPPWFEGPGRHLPSSAVVLTYPFPTSGLAAPMTWQAATGLTWNLVGGRGVTPDPPPHPTHAQRIDADIAAHLADASDGLGPLPTADPVLASHLRQAMNDWGVTDVVVPDESSWPLSLRGRSVAAALTWFGAALGHPPTFRDGAWVWHRTPEATSSYETVSSR